MWKRWAGPVVLVMSLGACSDGDDAPPSDAGGDGDRAEAVELLTAEFAGNDDPNGLLFTETEARCAAEAVVEGLGADRVIELDAEEGAGSIATALDADEQDALFEAMTGCIDLEGQLEAALTDGGLTADAARCVAERYLATDLPKRSMMSDYDPELNAEIDAALAEAYEGCGAA